MMEFERRCWAEVDLGALRHNFKLVRERAGDAAVMAVVKADAYGHGDAVVAPLLEQEGADQFAVSGFGEAVCLRRAGVTKPILILGYTGVQNAAAPAVGGISQTVFSLEYARALSEAALSAGVAERVPLQVDTGTGRRRCTRAGRFCTKSRDVRRLEASKRAFQPSCRRSLQYSSDRYNIDQAFSKATKTARNTATDKVSNVAAFCAESALRRARLLALNHRRRSQTLMTASTTCRREQHQQRQRECGLRYRRRGFWTRETQRS